MQTRDRNQGLGLYLRISQDDGTTLAVERQEAECRAKAAALGLSIAKVYIDQGKSASSKKVVRPAYNEMLADARDGRVDGVIAWAHDRLTRQPEQLGDWLDLSDHGFKLVTVAGELDLSSDAGRFAARIFVAMAEQEVRKKGARQVSANRQRAEQGLPITRGRLFGYLDGGMELDPVEAPLIAEAVAGLIAGTASMHGTAKSWNRLGVLSSRGKPWTTASLRHLVTSWRIAGLLSYKKGTELFPAQWPAIVSREDLETLRSILSAPGRNSTTKDTSVRNLLSHVMRCGSCDPSVGVNGMTRARGEKAYGCPRCFVSISRGIADTRVKEAVADKLSDPGYEVSTSAATVRVKRAELAEVVRTGERLSEMFTEGQISLDQFALMNAGPSSARKALEGEITSLVQRDAVTALVDGLRLTEGPFRANTVGNIHANAATIRERFEALDINQQRTVIRGLLPVIRLNRAATAGKQSAAATRARITIGGEQ